MTPIESLLAKSKEIRDGTTPPDCGDNSCPYAIKRGGMRTNGGCRCYRDSGFEARQYVLRLHHSAKASQSKDEIIEIAVEALEYIKDHASFADKPKWGNEFVQVAIQALSRINEIAAEAMK